MRLRTDEREQALHTSRMSPPLFAPLRLAGSPEAEDADSKLSQWTDAYHRLKIAQALIKASGTRATLQMRADRDRLQRGAEQALKALTAHNSAAKRGGTQDKPHTHRYATQPASPAPRSLHGLHGSARS